MGTLRYIFAPWSIIAQTQLKLDELINEMTKLQRRIVEIRNEVYEVWRQNNTLKMEIELYKAAVSVLEEKNADLATQIAKFDGDGDGRIGGSLKRLANGRFASNG